MQTKLLNQKKNPRLSKQILPNPKQKLGNKGECLVKTLLQHKGWQFITRNFHTRFGEIDLIFLDQNTLVFIEVKTRTSNRMGLPEEAITRGKLRNIQKTAEIFLTKYPQFSQHQVRIDIAAVECTNGEENIRYYNNMNS